MSWYKKTFILHIWIFVGVGYFALLLTGFDFKYLWIVLGFTVFSLILNLHGFGIGHNGIAQEKTESDFSLNMIDDLDCPIDDIKKTRKAEKNHTVNSDRLDKIKSLEIPEEDF